ncbi:MAG: HAMP domain-containing sensor histidine kinase [Chromatiales bacterium]
MKLPSLRVRLLVAAVFSISLALVAAGFGLSALFGHHVERRLDMQLETYLHELIGRIEPDGNDGIRLTHELSDPRFEEPLSGLYWQIQDDKYHALIRSRSLWDNMLPLPHDLLKLGVVHRHELAGPDGQSLLVREQQVIVFPETDAHRLRVVVAVDRSDLIEARDAFTRDLLPYLAFLALALLLASWFQVRTGLSPLDRVRLGVLSIRSGETARLPSAFPEEVQPLIDEINQLLDSRDQAVENARAWTADLAHGLKTPITALSADAQRLRTQGESGMADDLEHLAQSMRQRIDRELIRARLRSEAGGRPRHSDLVKTLQGLVNTLQRTPAGKRLAWDMQLPQQAEVTVSPDDLAELLGNILDNAGKWAQSLVRIRLQIQQNTHWLVNIEDDGPGVAEQQRANLGQRGLRLDEQTTGTGLGLAIARDIISAYNSKIEFGVAEAGGLKVSLKLPTRQPADRG